MAFLEYGGTYQLFDEVASTNVKSRKIRLPEPCTRFSFQAVASASSAEINLLGSLASSSDAGTETILSWSSDTSGAILSTQSTDGIYAYAEAEIIDNTTDGTVSAWLTALP